jgi:hypothetical protein
VNLSRMTDLGEPGRVVVSRSDARRAEQPG